jgi:putative endonuclease
VELLSLEEPSWFVYLLKCSDDSYYTGITQNLNNRFERHSAGRGPKYTQIRLPVKLVLTISVKNESEAMLKEKWLKRQSHRVKEELIKEWEVAQKASPNRG